MDTIKDIDQHDQQELKAIFLQLDEKAKRLHEP